MGYGDIAVDRAHDGADIACCRDLAPWIGGGAGVWDPLERINSTEGRSALIGSAQSVEMVARIARHGGVGMEGDRRDIARRGRTAGGDGLWLR